MTDDIEQLEKLRADIERRIAVWYEQHRDDPGLWSDDPGVKVQPRRLGAAVSVSFPADEWDAVRQAVRDGEKLSAFIREAVAFAVWTRTRPVPAHTCNLVGCAWCDPLGRTTATWEWAA